MKSGIIFLFQYHYENFELEETHKRRGGRKKALKLPKTVGRDWNNWPQFPI